MNDPAAQRDESDERILFLGLDSFLIHLSQEGMGERQLATFLGVRGVEPTAATLRSRNGHAFTTLAHSLSEGIAEQWWNFAIEVWHFAGSQGRLTVPLHPHAWVWEPLRKLVFDEFGVDVPELAAPPMYAYAGFGQPWQYATALGQDRDWAARLLTGLRLPLLIIR
jgi:hypothetical protein